MLLRFLILAIVGVFTLFGYKALGQDENKVDAAIVFVVDVSSSMSNKENAVVSEGHVLAIQSREVLNAIRSGRHQRILVSYVKFASGGRIVVPWMVIDGKETAFQFAYEVLGDDEPLTGGTAIVSGLALALSMLQATPYEPEKMVVDIVGDGKDNSSTGLFDVRQKVLDTGATINGLPLIIDPDDDDLEQYYIEELIGGPAAFSLPVREISDFPLKIRQKLLLELF